MRALDAAVGDEEKRRWASRAKNCRIDHLVSNSLTICLSLSQSLSAGAIVARRRAVFIVNTTAHSVVLCVWNENIVMSTWLRVVGTWSHTEITTFITEIAFASNIIEFPPLMLPRLKIAKTAVTFSAGWGSVTSKIACSAAHWAFPALRSASQIRISIEITCLAGIADVVRAHTSFVAYGCSGPPAQGDQTDCCEYSHTLRLYPVSKIKALKPAKQPFLATLMTLGRLRV